jgi:GNAT superfamily N-acetyltransferase
MTAAFTLNHGLPADMRDQAVALYWQAFGPKLGRVMGPEDKALRYLSRVMRLENGIGALDGQGRLLGLAGFKTDQGSFAGGTMADLAEVYGQTGSLWRGMLLRTLSDESDPEMFLLDGLCVADGARGQGVGTALVNAICDEARRRGYHAVRLDVIEGNDRARALYERAGFLLDRTARIGALRHVFGFAAAHVMVRRL